MRHGGGKRIEHILPLSAGGLTTRENLWLVCHCCNKFQGNRMEAVDSVTGTIVRLFNPRVQPWHEYMPWSAAGTLVLGVTPCGRATVEALQMDNV